MVIEADEDLLHRAVFNLMLNAIQASPAGAEVVVEVVPDGDAVSIPFGVSLGGGTVAVRISDNGPGIPLEIRDRLFDPFFTTKPHGTGLGLAVVQRAVEAHRGMVLVDSAPPPGCTRFTVTLPRTRSTAPAIPPVYS